MVDPNVAKEAAQELRSHAAKLRSENEFGHSEERRIATQLHHMARLAEVPTTNFKRAIDALVKRTDTSAEVMNAVHCLSKYATERWAEVLKHEQGLLHLAESLLGEQDTDNPKEEN